MKLFEKIENILEDFKITGLKSNSLYSGLFKLFGNNNKLLAHVDISGKSNVGNKIQGKFDFKYKFTIYAGSDIIMTFDMEFPATINFETFAKVKFDLNSKDVFITNKRDLPSVITNMVFQGNTGTKPDNIYGCFKEFYGNKFPDKIPEDAYNLINDFLKSCIKSNKYGKYVKNIKTFY